MKISTSKITAVLFLLTLFIPLLFIFSFTIQRQAIRHKMKERLEEQLLQTISIADKNIHWVEKGREILVNGRMFDIESTRHGNDTTTFTGLYDDDETLLVKQLDENWDNNSPLNNQFLKQIFDCLQNIFCPLSSGICFLPGKQTNLIDPLSFNLLNQFGTVPTPPPQVCASCVRHPDF